jgi:hypothetical protein
MPGIFNFGVYNKSDSGDRIQDLVPGGGQRTESWNSRLAIFGFQKNGLFSRMDLEFLAIVL